MQSDNSGLTDKKLKVLTLGWDFDPAISGGVGPACQGLARALRACGVDLIYLVPGYAEEDFFHQEKI